MEKFRSAAKSRLGSLHDARTRLFHKNHHKKVVCANFKPSISTWEVVMKVILPPCATPDRHIRRHREENFHHAKERV
ncbi:uncharacterized protein LOC143177745 isoform X11 [Calliopsis andreniformis]|uniref:uncharacterized protein LOC143177745 isoform X11 n=1 Tax=Calliopsis andreniformis TaxID=337506 RepID=UPI003FCD3CB9